MTAIEKINYAVDLPAGWDALTEHYFQKRIFLEHAEKFNPCNQRYYIFREGEKLKAAAVVYSLKIDLLTYPRLKSQVNMQVLGIPCSVSCTGLFGEANAATALKQHIFTLERGFVLALNLEAPRLQKSNALGHTLPAIILENHFNSWENYRKALRSDYRRRLIHLYRSGEHLEIRRTACSAFTEAMYQQYLEVFRRSKARLEKLPFPFFSNLPGQFTLNACYDKGITAGWTISLNHEKTHYFFMGGVNRAMDNAHAIYLLLLAEIVREGIDLQSVYIDLGQTAEIPKMRMGGLPHPRFMEAHISCTPLNALLKLLSKTLEYRIHLPEAHIYPKQP